MSECYTPEPAGSSAYVDVDGDGYAETTVVDSDGDGVVDTVLTDVDGDGLDDIAEFDNAPDDEFVADVVAVDVTGDGTADAVFDDVDLDGVFDTVTRGTGVPLADANPYGGPAGTGGDSAQSS
jgi:hypothetical protein